MWDYFGGLPLNVGGFPAFVNPICLNKRRKNIHPYLSGLKGTVATSKPCKKT
jgi:hypothetical protein